MPIFFKQPFHLSFYPKKAYLRILVKVILPCDGAFDHTSLTSEVEIGPLLSYGWRGIQPQKPILSVCFLGPLLLSTILGWVSPWNKFWDKNLSSSGSLRRRSQKVPSGSEDGGRERRKANRSYVNGQVAAVGNSDSILTGISSCFPSKRRGTWSVYPPNPLDHWMVVVPGSINRQTLWPALPAGAERRPLHQGSANCSLQVNSSPPLFIRTQPSPFVYVSSVAAFTLQVQNRVAVRKTALQSRKHLLPGLQQENFAWLLSVWGSYLDCCPFCTSVGNPAKNNLKRTSLHTLVHIFPVFFKTAFLGYNWYTKKLHVFNGHNLVNLDMCRHPWYHHRNHGTKHLYHHQTFSCPFVLFLFVCVVRTQRKI